MRRLALALALLTSCSDDSKHDYEWIGGYEVAFRDDRGSLAAGLYTKEQAVGWLHTRVGEWVASHPDGNPDELWMIARRTRYLLVDAPYWCQSGGCVAGMQMQGSVAAGVWASDPWMPGLDALPAIPHELDHVIGIHHD